MRETPRHRKKKMMWIYIKLVAYLAVSLFGLSSLLTQMREFTRNRTTEPIAYLCFLWADVILSYLYHLVCPEVNFNGYLLFLFFLVPLTFQDYTERLPSKRRRRRDALQQAPILLD